MLNVNLNSKIFVMCPPNVKTGGTELLHQLVNSINNMGGKAYIYYIGDNSSVLTRPDAFKCYVSDAQIVCDISDYRENVLVVPETLICELNKYNALQKVVWWLSVDNFSITNGVISHMKIEGLTKTLKHIFIDKKCYKTIDLKRINAIHLHQSYYALDYLIKKGVKQENMHYLSDYLNSVYLENNASFENRKNNVMYNPKKGIKFTKKLIEANPQINWIPIANMTTNEVYELLNQSKVYIDFGQHPGKDRFPREAAICGCCVITNKQGSANFENDVPIPEQFKIQDKPHNIGKILDVIQECLSNYNNNTKLFVRYRNFILNERKSFENDVMDIFSVNKQ